MQRLLARRVDIAWVLLTAALSGAALVLLLAVQATATPNGQVFIVRAEPTSIPGQGGAPAGVEVGAVIAIGPSPTTPRTPPTPSVIPTPISTAFPERPVEPPLPEADVPSTPVPTFAPTPFPTTPALAPGSRININRASATELEALPGIGTVLAARIVQDREANGPFATVEDLKRVRGIGDGIMGKVRDFVEVGP